MKILYKNIGILIIILVFGFSYSQNVTTSDCDSLKAVYQAENPPIIKKSRTRDGGNSTYKVKEQIYIDEELHKTTDGYWVIKGIELYKKDALSFEHWTPDKKAKIRINGVSKLFNIGDSLEVGNLILKERDKITKKYTGNVLINRPYKGVIEMILARLVYVKNYLPHSAIKLSIHKDPKIVYKDIKK